MATRRDNHLSCSTTPDSPRWFLTMHALQRMSEMHLCRASVVQTLERPELTWPAHEGRRIAAANGIAVVFHPSNLAVITVLWHTDEDWTRESATPGIDSHAAVA